MIKSFWKTNISCKFIIWPNFIPKCYPREMKMYIHITSYISVFITSWLTSLKIWKKLKYTSTNECMNNLRCICSKGYYTAMERGNSSWTKQNEGNWDYVKWKNPDIKSTYYVISFLWSSWGSTSSSWSQSAY